MGVISPPEKGASPGGIVPPQTPLKMGGGTLFTGCGSRVGNHKAIRKSDSVGTRVEPKTFVGSKGVEHIYFYGALGKPSPVVNVMVLL